MSTVVQAPPRTPAPIPAPPPAPDRPWGRRWLLGFWAAVLVAFLAVSPGKMTFETKLGVALDPLKFLGDLGELWHDRAGFGGIFDQYIGYAFPILPYYALMDLAHVPVWIAERLWLSIIITTAFWGALRLAERLRVGTPATRLLAALGYALWPTFTVVIGSTSAAVLPGALLPWVVLPLTSAGTSARVAATRSALLIPFMGGVNAASTLASLLPVGLYLLSRPGGGTQGRRKRALLAWWIPGVVLATAWWVVPLLLLGTYGENFMPYVEQAKTTTGTMSATELLRGAGNWVAYLNFGEAWLPAGWTVATAVVTVLCSGFAAALGLGGLARRDLPERRWLLLTVLAVALITLVGYGGSLGGPFHGTVQGWLDGWLKPFRNIYKFQPGLALALAFGLAHLLGVAGRPAASSVALRIRTGWGRFAPAIAAVLVLPGLAWPYVNGSILQPGAFEKLPGHWSSAADWLEKYAPDNRALVVPATAHGIYTWGSPIDQPLDVLAESRWAQRDYVPFGTPGSRRAMDAVEQALMSGGEVPGLREFLARAGLHTVVVRNDLDPDQIGYVPPQTVKRTLQASGYRKVAAFGPLLTGGRIPDDTPIQVQGLFPRQRAVEIYEPDGAGAPERPKQLALRPVAGTAVVSGGPEALLQLSADPSLRDRPAVLSGDNHPGVGTPPIQAVADGLRRADTRFGLVNSNTSYTYTPSERNHPDSVEDPGKPPKQLLPEGTRLGHQTTAVLRGARSVTASSSGNWLFHLPQYEPANAFDGNPDTAWAEGSPGKPAGQWLRIGFSERVDVPSSIRVTPLPADGMRAAPTVVRVETDRGRAESPLQPNGAPQSVKAPEGRASWLRIRILDAQEAGPGLSGAGFSEVSIPDVQVTRLLTLPRDAEGADAPAAVYSLHRGSDPGGLSPASAEVGLHRRFTTPAEADYRVTARALAVPGDALDQLLDQVAPGKRKRITATADSTSRTGISLSPRNLVDGDLTTAWIAGARPVVHLRWPGKKKIDEIVFAPAGGVSTRPEEVLISSPDGAATVGVDKNGLARFDPITTDRLDIAISRAAPMTVHNPVADSQLQLPVGLSEVYVPALDDLRVPRPAPDDKFTVPCGAGPALAVDGTLHTTEVSGFVRDLTERRPVDVRLCAGEAKDGTLGLDPGRHVVEAGDAGPLALTDVTLSRGEPAPVSSGTRFAKAVDWRGDRRTVSVGAGEASYLQTYENANDGWKATLNGRELTPLRLDGWQQAWLIPAGEAGTVRLEYEPAALYEGSLIGGAIGVAVLVALAFIRRRSASGGDRRASAEDSGGPQAPPQTSARVEPPAWTPPAPGWVLGTVALTVVVALVAGPLALVVPALAVVARLRPGLLVPIALTAMAGAAVAAATGAGEPVAVDEGAFSTPAQVLAIVGLAAALVTADRPARAEDSHEPDGPEQPSGSRSAEDSPPAAAGWGSLPGTTAPLPSVPGDPQDARYRPGSSDTLRLGPGGPGGAAPPRLSDGPTTAPGTPPAQSRGPGIARATTAGLEGPGNRARAGMQPEAGPPHPPVGPVVTARTAGVPPLPAQPYRPRLGAGGLRSRNLRSGSASSVGPEERAPLPRRLPGTTWPAGREPGEPRPGDASSDAPRSRKDGR
ncbi:alpha-(1-_3)-arabinofuranosyltransferase domain-containing protein [Streptomyces sp. KR80]|uniref:alpha-(1->3)-arabinofuranosyltransferase domain-containing protein n=1 Tax=Streptomyces sp. KR80 TaxID=3457426 RepID=UPI003FD4B0FD